MENLSNDSLLRRMDRIGDKLSDMELIHEWNEEQKTSYETLESQYSELKNEYESRKGK